MARLCPDQTTHVRRQITQRCLLITRCNAGQSVDGSADYKPPSGALKKREPHPPVNGQNQLSLHGRFSHQHTKELCLSSQFSHCRLQSDQHHFNHQIFFFFFFSMKAHFKPFFLYTVSLRLSSTEPKETTVTAVTISHSPRAGKALQKFFKLAGRTIGGFAEPHRL